MSFGNQQSDREPRENDVPIEEEPESFQSKLVHLLDSCRIFMEVVFGAAHQEKLGLQRIHTSIAVTCKQLIENQAKNSQKIEKMERVIADMKEKDGAQSEVIRQLEAVVKMMKSEEKSVREEEVQQEIKLQQVEDDIKDAEEFLAACSGMEDFKRRIEDLRRKYQ